MSNVNLENRIAVNRAIQVIDVFRELNRNMPVGEAMSFLLIAQGETKDGGGLTVTELTARGGFSLAAASRYMHSLGAENRKGDPGHQLVTSERDATDDRRKVLRVTPLGTRILRKLQAIIGE